ALLRGMAILAAEQHGAAGDRLADRGDERRRRADQEIAIRLAAPDEIAGEREPDPAQPVHLPITGDQLAPFSCHRASPPSLPALLPRRLPLRGGAFSPPGG